MDKTLYLQIKYKTFVYSDTNFIIQLLEEVFAFKYSKHTLTGMHFTKPLCGTKCSLTGKINLL